jgi:septal ring factor EnvC (AmiA/AmiB activator)
MKLPVTGTITAHYGSKRADGPSWKGIFIQTPHGAEVRSVANGEVIFADWLRGFGNLIILDHGSQYMTIYANAQTLRKKVGDNVKGGDIIANAGNSSDNAQTGLYFEMRHNGRAFNPMDWAVTR